MLRQSWWISRMYLSPDGDGAASGGGTSSDSTATAPDTKADATASVDAAKATDDAALGDAGKLALQRERDARKAAEDQLKTLQKAQTDRETEEAKKRGDFEKLADDRQAQIELLQAQLAERDAAQLKRTIAAKHKLNAELAARLVGDTEAELEEDAKALAKMIGTREAPDTEAGAGSANAKRGTSDMPIPPAKGDKTAAVTFDGRPKVAWNR